MPKRVQRMQCTPWRKHRKSNGRVEEKRTCESYETKTVCTVRKSANGKDYTGSCIQYFKIGLGGGRWRRGAQDWFGSGTMKGAKRFAQQVSRHRTIEWRLPRHY